MMIGHEKLKADFIKLTKNGNLSHAYLFFGEPQVGKSLFALSLANYLENSVFETPKTSLKEALIISLERIISEEASRETIGIDTIHALQRFLYQKPIFSPRRTVIIKDAENLTSQAQNAVLKIIEEPPAESLLIFIVDNPDTLLPALLSRFQKIYFSRVDLKQISDFLAKNFSLNPQKAKLIALESFGRPGRAIKLVQSSKLKIKSFKFNDINKIVENNQIDEFFESLIGDLAKDPVKNYKKLKQALNRLVLMKQFNVNKKLQLNALSGVLSEQNAI